MNEKSSGSRSRKQRLTAEGTRYAGHVTPLYSQKLALTSPTGSGRSVDIVRVRTKATEFFKGNDNTIATETCVTMEVETEVQNKKIDPEEISKTRDRTTAAISRAQKVKVFGEAAREGLEEQAKKMKATSSKSSQNLLSDKMLE